MDLFILNQDLDCISIIDTYNSLIWTDRYQEYGDFELYKAMSADILGVIRPGHYISRNDSEHTMIVEEISIKSDTEEGAMITVTGRSLESLLNRRIIWGLKNLNGSLQDSIKTLLDENVMNPSDPNRKIENFIFEESKDPKILELTIDTQFTGDNLYDVLNSICVERGIGFRLILNNKKQFVFSLYSGDDRSYEQTNFPYVIFSPNFENFISGEYLESKMTLKNATLIGGEGEGSERRYASVGEVAGLERREIFTDARDISSDSSEDLTESADFSKYPSEVFDENTKTFVTNSYFDSCMIDISKYVGRTLSITIPQYTNAEAQNSGFATVLVDENKNYVSTLQVWESYGEYENRGSLKTYEFLIPENAKFLYTSMFNQSAIDSDVYYGEIDDFKCSTVKLSDKEYTSLLEQRGNEKLSENKETLSFEGEAETTVMFKYGTDFFIGDIVQIEDGYGHESKARVLEIITSEDESGFATYPTFTTITEEGV